MRVALFITCLTDTLFPRRAGRRSRSSSDRRRRRLPRGADVLRADAREHAATDARRCRWSGVSSRASARGCRCGCRPVGLVRRDGPRPLRRPRARVGDAGLAARPSRRSRRASSSCPSSRRRTRRRGRRRVLTRTASTYHPSCHALRMLRVGDAPLRLLRNVAASTSSNCPRREECCGFGGTFAVKNADVSTAMLSDKLAHDPRHRRRGLHRARQLLPDAHRRRPDASAAGVRTLHLAEILAVRRRRPAMTRGGLPAGGRARALARRASCAATSQSRRDDDPRQARRASSPRSPDWEELREAGGAIKATRCGTSTSTCETLEAVGARAPAGTSTGPATQRRPTAIVADDRARAGAREVVKVKSILTDEIGLNDALARRRHRRARDRPRRADRPARRRPPLAHPRPRDPPQPRRDPRALPRELPGRRDLTDEPAALADAARAATCARSSSSARVAVSGANFAVAETGTVCVVESEGNGRMCTTLPETLITVMGIEKVLPRLADLEVMLQLLPRSSTAERMNPYTSLWTGVTPGDGPQEFHLVLLDAGRTDVARRRRRTPGPALHPLLGVPERLPGLRARRRPRLRVGLPGPDRRDPRAAARRTCRTATTLPWASSLCGACYDVCPVKIDIPRCSSTSVAGSSPSDRRRPASASR